MRIGPLHWAMCPPTMRQNFRLMVLRSKSWAIAAQPVLIQTFCLILMHPTCAVDRLANMTAKSPNITLIMADQLAPRYLPSYGHPIVPAPTLHRLSEEGVTFDAAYTNSPLCAPSRFVMMIGRLPSNISTWDNAVEFSAEVPTFHPLPGVCSKASVGDLF